MFISYVLRVRPDRLREQQFAAELEAVATGQRAWVRSAEEAQEFVMTTMFTEMAATQRARHVGEEP